MIGMSERTCGWEARVAGSGGRVVVIGVNGPAASRRHRGPMRAHGSAGALARATAGSDAVEVKTTVAPHAQARALALLGLRHGDGVRRRVYFFDTPGLELHSCGLLLRARATAGAPDDSTVKVRPVNPERVARWRGVPGFKVQADVVGSTVVRAASLTAIQPREEIEAAAEGRGPIARLLSREQEQFLGALAPRPIELDRLVPLGPVQARRWDVSHAGLPYRLCAEAWRLPGGRSLLELSIKAEPAAAAAAVAAFSGFLEELGILVDSEPQTKTRAALTSLAAQSRAHARASERPGVVRGE
jgi:hypothetical protein